MYRKIENNNWMINAILLCIISTTCFAYSTRLNAILEYILLCFQWFGKLRIVVFDMFGILFSFYELNVILLELVALLRFFLDWRFIIRCWSVRTISINVLTLQQSTSHCNKYCLLVMYLTIYCSCVLSLFRLYSNRFLFRIFEHSLSIIPSLSCLDKFQVF